MESMEDIHQEAMSVLKAIRKSRQTGKEVAMPTRYMCPCCDSEVFTASNGMVRCDKCGGRRNFALGQHTWTWTCGQCGKEVKPGRLVGLFVPHLCEKCEAKTAKQEVKEGMVCRVCFKPTCRCRC